MPLLWFGLVGAAAALVHLGLVWRLVAGMSWLLSRHWALGRGVAAPCEARG